MSHVCVDSFLGNYGAINMGKIDEHWCNNCKRKLDKKKDKYIEFELVNVKPKKGKQKAKGIICQECINKEPQLKKSVELMIKAGNPKFEAQVKCLNKQQCEKYEPKYKTFIDCKHIAVIKGDIYCKRSHPGILKLPREKQK